MRDPCLVTVVDAKDHQGPIDKQWFIRYLTVLKGDQFYHRPDFLAGMVITNIAGWPGSNVSHPRPGHPLTRATRAALARAFQWPGRGYHRGHASESGPAGRVARLGVENVITMDAREYLKELGNEWLDISTDAALASTLSPGPYLYTGKTLRKAFQLRSDTQRAFVVAIGSGDANGHVNPSLTVPCA